MADSDVKFTVVADTRAAKGELSDLEKAAERVQNAANRGGGGGGGGGGNPPRPGGEGEEFGKAAGKQIGKALAGFMAREASGILFNELRRRGIGGDSLDIWQGALGGALAFGTTGAMIGGPWGAAIGGGLGAAAGGIKVWQEQEELKQKQIDDINDSSDYRAMDITAWTQSAAINKLIQLAPKADRYNTIVHYQEEATDRADSLRKIMMEKIEEGEDQSSLSFKALAFWTKNAEGMVKGLNQAAMSELMDMAKPFSPPDIAVDAFARRGLYAGAMVTPDAYQGEISQSVKRAVDLLEKLVEASQEPDADARSLSKVAVQAIFGD